MNKYLVYFSHSISITCILSVLLILAGCSYNGLLSGDYSVTVDSNMFCEHWFEFILVFVGLYVYLKVNHVKFGRKVN